MMSLKQKKRATCSLGYTCDFCIIDMLLRGYLYIVIKGVRFLPSFFVCFLLTPDVRLKLHAPATAKLYNVLF
jgi:hypothetical protein